MADILTKNEKKLKIFEDKVVIDKKLIKWRKAEKGLSKTNINDKPNNNEYDNDNSVISSYFLTTPDYDGNSLEAQINSLNNDIDSEINASTKWLPLYEIAEGINFDTIASAGIQELTRYIAENKLKFVIGGYGSIGRTQILFEAVSNEDEKNVSVNKKFKTNFLSKIKNIFKNKPSTIEDNYHEIDALQFFKLVKLSSKEGVSTYRDRVSDYLRQIYNAATIGQIALLEDLIRGMVTNKYESVLFAEGYYYAVNETQIVEFVKKCEKGIKLDYIKNFTRPIPQNIVDKIQHINNLEVFDNYVVLYYDPEGKIYKETAKEEAKRKDPIIFGVIAGSEKLYYIADWTDEYCDLTLEKFIDIIGIEKETLNIDYHKN